MGSVLLQMGRAQDAIAAYDEALARAPDDPQALSGKASALLAAGKRAESAELVQQVARLEADAGSPRVEQQANAQAAVWAGGPERLLAAAEASRRDGQERAAIDGFVAAAAGLSAAGSSGRRPGCLPARIGCLAGAPAAHLQMARIYFQRGWADRGVERLLLLSRLLTLEEDPMTREGVVQLARTHQASEPRLATIAAGGVV